jgi:RNase P/RNase MRP subunit p29
MKIFKTISVLALAGALFLALPVVAGPQAKTYQVTGPVLELTDTIIVVQKGDEKWQVARDKGTKVTGDLKVGAKVTIQYRCVATDVEVKAEKTEKKSP